MQENMTGKWRRVLVNVSVCLLTSHPIPNVIFTFAPLGVVLKMHEDTKMASCNFKFKANFGSYADISYVDSTDETRR